MRPPASPKSRFEWVAGNRELAARLTTQRSVTIRQPRRYIVESLNTLLARHSERGVQITGRSRLHHMKLNPQVAVCHPRHSPVGVGRPTRINEHGHPRQAGHRLLQKLQALARQVICNAGDTSDVSAWAREAGDETFLDGISVDVSDNDRDGGGRPLESRDWSDARDKNAVQLELDQLGD